MDNGDTLGVLRRLERGEIDAAQAGEWLARPAISESIDDDEPGFSSDRAAVDFNELGAPGWVRRLWFYPLVAGLITVGMGVWIIMVTVHANPLWLLIGLPVLLLGTLVVAISASAQSGHWLYVKIEGAGRKHKSNLSISVPFPLGLLRGALSIARWVVPHPRFKFNAGRTGPRFGGDWKDADAFLQALERELAEGHPVTVDVQDHSEHVQVYIV